MKAINAVYISSVFLKYLIENAQSNNIEDLCLSLDESEPVPDGFIRGISHITYGLFVTFLHASLVTGKDI